MTTELAQQNRSALGDARVPSVESVPIAQRRHAPIALGLLGVVLAIGVWEMAPLVGIVSPHDVPPASRVVAELGREAGSGQYWGYVASTLTTWAIGLAVATGVGVLIGLLVGSIDVVWRALRPTIEFLRPVPGVALIPVVTVLWGQSLGSGVFLVVWAAFWIMLIQTMYGVRAVDDVTLSTTRVFGLGPLSRLYWVVVPSALPYIATGLRLASAVALIVSITVELVIGLEGLGLGIKLASAAGNTEAVYSLIFTSGILGIVIHIVFSRVESRFLHWHQSQRTLVGEL